MGKDTSCELGGSGTPKPISLTIPGYSLLCGKARPQTWGQGLLAFGTVHRLTQARAGASCQPVFSINLWKVAQAWGWLCHRLVALQDGLPREGT